MQKEYRKGRKNILMVGSTKGKIKRALCAFTGAVFLLAGNSELCLAEEGAAGGAPAPVEAPAPVDVPPAVPADPGTGGGSVSDAGTSGDAGGAAAGDSVQPAPQDSGNTVPAEQGTQDPGNTAPAEQGAGQGSSAETPEGGEQGAVVPEGGQSADETDSGAGQDPSGEGEADAEGAGTQETDADEAAKQAAAAAAYYYWRTAGYSGSGVVPASSKNYKPAEDAVTLSRKIRLTKESKICLEGLEEIKRSLDKTWKHFDISGKDPVVFGDWELPEEQKLRLQELLEKTEKSGSHIGIVMLDIQTGKGIAVQPDRRFYGASSIKGPYVLSLAMLNPKTINTRLSTFRAIAVNSDNNAYDSLVGQYGRNYIDAWRLAVDAGAPLTAGCYAYLSAEDLARLWIMGYQYLTTKIDGEVMGELFETPNQSAIHTVLGKRYTTQTKAGWISQSVSTTADAGIVYAGDHPYILAIASDYGSNFKRLEPYVELMEEMHEAMVLQEGA